MLPLAAAFIATAAAALFFRTYPLNSHLFISEKTIQRQAEKLTRLQMSRQLEARLPAGVPARKLAEQKLNELIAQDRASFDRIVAGTAEQIKKKRKEIFSYKYLSEADPYYYLNLTQNVAATGRLGTRIPGGRFFNPLRHAPFGNPDVINLHPYVGAAVYDAAKAFRPGLSLMQAVGLTPLFLIVLSAAAYFALWPFLGVRLFPFWLAAQAFFLSPVVIQRSTLGWYDTDAYNLIFPLLIFATLLAVLSRPRQAVRLGLVGGFLTGFYPLFWQGWPFIFALVAFAGFAAGLARFVIYRTGAERTAFLTYALVYTGASLFFAVWFITPLGFWDTVLNGFLYSSRVQGGSSELWPNLLVLVGETGQATFKKWVYLTSHYGVVLFALLGLILPPLQRRASLAWTLVTLMALPLLIFSFAAERFSILAVFPLTLLAAYGLDGMLTYAESAGRALNSKMQGAGTALRGAAFALLTLAIVPRTLMGAHVSGFQSHFIMNDVWYEVLDGLGKSAPKNAIVHSWWPPGYFVNAISGLRTVVDGGSHHFHENFWMAKAFMSTREKEARGLFRMLAAGGNGAMEFLDQHGIRGDQAVELLLKIAVLDRPQAAGILPGAWTLKDKKDLLDLTHGGQDGPAPSYVLIYEDMVKQNLALQVIDHWSFERARKIFLEAPKPSGLRALWAAHGAGEYTKKMLQVTGQGLPYEEPAPAVARQDGKVIFKNGVSFDPASGRAVLQTPNGQVPVRSVYKKDGKWAAAVPPLENSAIAALILPEGGNLFCVAAHRDLVPSLLFKLAYLDGYGLSSFEPVLRRGSIQNSDYVAVYKIKWD